MCQTFGKHFVLFFADNFTGSKDTEPYKTDVSFLCQYIYTMHLNYDKSYLKAHDSISLDVMINYMLNGIPFTICLSLFHVLWAGGLNRNIPFVLVLDNRR